MDVSTLLGRQKQLDLLAYGLALLLLIAIGVLVWALTANVDVTSIGLLRERPVTFLAMGLMAAFIGYLGDQQRRLRVELKKRDAELQAARDDLADSFDRLSFAHRALEIMSREPYGRGMERLLKESAHHFDGDAAAIIGGEMAVFSEPGVSEEEVIGDILPVSIQCVARSRPVSIGSHPGGGTVMAVPLRVHGSLDHVFCIWRRAGAFAADELEGLVLVARIIELSSENRALNCEMAVQATG